jgi:hypothetical protein
MVQRDHQPRSSGGRTEVNNHKTNAHVCGLRGFRFSRVHAVIHTELENLSLQFLFGEIWWRAGGRFFKSYVSVTKVVISARARSAPGALLLRKTSATFSAFAPHPRTCRLCARRVRSLATLEPIVLLFALSDPNIR